MKRRQRIAVALSGGKDSTAAVLLLCERGYDVHAATMLLGIPGEEERLAKVANLARTLALDWRALDLRGEFHDLVIAYFLSAYRSGRTPNPCLVCNRRLKFGLLLRRLLRGREHEIMATGHYASIAADGQRLFLAEPAERSKSQIYFLSQLEPRALRRIVFPLADMTVAAVRQKVAGLELANREESQDACFLAGQDLLSYLRRSIPAAFAPGDIVDTAGRVLGRHEGVVQYTIGQRRGTRLAAGKRLYVIRTDVEKKTVTLGEGHHLLASALRATSPVYWRPLRPGERYLAKIRYQHRGEEAEIELASAAALRIRFQAPVRAITPGQFVVLYEGDRIVASAEIEAP